MKVYTRGCKRYGKVYFLLKLELVYTRGYKPQKTCDYIVAIFFQDFDWFTKK
jgi:hypothetical protein